MKTLESEDVLQNGDLYGSRKVLPEFIGMTVREVEEFLLRHAKSIPSIDPELKPFKRPE